MKKFILIAVLVGALAALLSGTAMAAGPATPAAQGYGPGNGAANVGAGTCVGAGAVGMMRRGAPEWAGATEEVAALLKMTTEEIQAERQAGKSLVQIAADKGVGEEVLIKTIVDAKKVDLAKLVADGKLTQAQMDLMVERMQTQVKTMVERTDVGRPSEQGQIRSGMGRGSRGGRGANR